MKGKFITLEGGEGAGKSTILNILRQTLEQQGIDVVVTREPGGTPVGEALRSILLNPQFHNLCPESELLLMFAARAQLVREVIIPALTAGKWVLSDRFTDASYAYQGGGRGQPLSRISELEQWTTAGIQPDLTLLLDLPVQQGLARAGVRSHADRIENETMDFFDRVRITYRKLADAEPNRFRVIDASQPLENVIAQTQSVLYAFYATLPS